MVLCSLTFNMLIDLVLFLVASHKQRGLILSVLLNDVVKLDFIFLVGKMLN